MRKLILGLGLMAVSRLLARRGPAGVARFASLPSLAAMIAGVAATQLMNRDPVPAKDTAPDQEPAGNKRNQSFWRRFSPQTNTGEAT